jgi:hypothetical protein
VASQNRKEYVAMTTFRAKGPWHDLDDDGHRFRLLVADRKVIGGVLRMATWMLPLLVVLLGVALWTQWKGWYR